MTTKALLGKYKVTAESLTEGVRIVLKEGLPIRLRPYGTTAFYEAYLEAAESIENLDSTKDLQYTNFALAKAVVVEIGEGDDMINTVEEIAAILDDPTYYRLKQEIVEAAKNAANFHEKKELK